MGSVLNLGLLRLECSIFPQFSCLSSYLVFNTSFTCFYEILTDPSYTSQTILFTYPLVDNCSLNKNFLEHNKPTIDGIVIEEIDLNSDLAKWLINNNVKIITNVDTRRITLELRGVKDSFFSVGNKESNSTFESLSTKEQIKKSNVSELYNTEQRDMEIDLLIIDCGIKKSMYKYFQDRNLNVKIVSFEENIVDICLKNNIKSVLISNGPGDPRELNELIEKIKHLINRVNLFGICLGHQLISLALGFDVYRMPFGHHGSNHGVLDVQNDKIIITSQNHNYAVNEQTVKSNQDISISYVNTLDGSIEGIISEKMRLYSVQFHPEAAPGPHDGYEILDKWIEIIRQ